MQGNAGDPAAEWEIEVRTAAGVTRLRVASGTQAAEVVKRVAREQNFDAANYRLYVISESGQRELLPSDPIEVHAQPPHAHTYMLAPRIGAGG